MTSTVGDSGTNGVFLNLGVSGSVTGFPVTGVFNAGASTINAKLWMGTAQTTTGQATFYPTTTGTSAGTPLFTTLLTVQANITSQTTTAANVPVCSLYSASTTSVVVNAIVPFSGARAPNGTYVTLLVVGV